MNNRVTGYTMIEVLVVVVIVSILAAFAYPSYLSQLRQSRRAEAAIALESLAQAQERFYARFRTYTSVVAAPDPCVGPACEAAPDPCAGPACGGLGQSSNSSANDYYVLTANGNATSYTMTATASGPQFKDEDCRTLTLNNVGIKGGTSASGQDTSDECW